MNPATANPKPAWRRYGMLAIKLLLTVATCWWIFTQIQWAAFWQTVSGVSLVMVAIVMVNRSLGVAISAEKWRQLLAIHDSHYPLRLLYKWYLIAVALSQFLPSLIGGDAYRVYKTYHNPTARVVSLLAVFIERVSGMLALLIMAWVAAIWDWSQTGHQLSGFVAALGGWVAAGTLVGGAVDWKGRLMHRLTELRWCPKPIKSVIRHAGDYRHHRGRVALVVLISFVFHGLRTLSTWLLLYGMGFTTDFGHLLIANAVVNLLGMLPITIGGLGLLEGGFMSVMVVYGLPAEAGVGVILLLRVLMIPFSLGGLGLYLLERDQPTPDDLRKAAQAQADAAPGEPADGLVPAPSTDLAVEPRVAPSAA
jgi:uncharacterized membrane protein YbhN (UPF0104 family)